MKYRSFNEELLIATALLINIFNDIIIDRRKHGLKRDYSKPYSLKEIAQQKIEIPCILGERSHILRSLENEAGRYKLPLIILSNKSIKTDTVRMVDLHSDVFYQQDSIFFDLDPEDPLYRPQQLGKRRAQPIIMDFDMTIITKYKEDLDQIISNWAVFFRPDVYVKWWSPRHENQTINSEIIWNQNIGFDLPIEYNPTNVFFYKGTTSFSFKTWLFPGMHSVENKIDPDTEAVIKKFKFYPNRSNWYDDEDKESGKDTNDTDDAWYFGEIEENEDNHENESEYDEENKYTLQSAKAADIGQMAFWGVDSKQDFYNIGTDEEGLKAGKYAVNNVFAQNYAPISGNTELLKTKTNTLIGDIFSKDDKYLINAWNKYQNYLQLDQIQNSLELRAFIKNVYFKGGFPEESMFQNPPSGDFLYHHFAKTYNRPSDKKLVSAQFGDYFFNTTLMSLDYNIDTKNFTLSAAFNDNNIDVKMISIFNSLSGIYQKISMDSVTEDLKNQIRFNFERCCDNEFNILSEKTKNQTKNVILFNKLLKNRDVQFFIEGFSFKELSMKILNILNGHKNSIELNELESGKYEIVFNNSKIKDILREKELEKVSFRNLSLLYQNFIDKNYYQIFANKFIYLILKSRSLEADDVDIFDIGILAPLQFNIYHAPIFEIAIPESRMLLGFAVDMKI